VSRVLARDTQDEIVAEQIDDIENASVRQPGNGMCRKAVPLDQGTEGFVGNLGVRREAQ
jgi:hypothetical protein